MWVRAKGASLTGSSLGSRDTERNATVSTSCKRFFTFREKGKEEKLICGTADSYGSPLPLNFLYSSEELHLN